MAIAPMIGAATACRMSVGYATVWWERTPKLVDLWFEAWAPSADTTDAANAFHKQVLDAAHESAQVVVDEFKRGLDEVEHWTRPREPAAKPGQAD